MNAKGSLDKVMHSVVVKRKKVPLPHRVLIFLLISLGVPGIAGADATKGPRADHELTITLRPERSELEGRDRIHIQQSDSGPIELLLAPRARIRSVRISGADHPYAFDRGRLTLDPDRTASIPTLELSIHYICRFDDSVPLRPVNTDNPGFGVTGTISAEGTFILSGAGWYPHLADARETFDLRVESPQNTVAVTAGRLQGIEHQVNRTVSHWRIDNPLEGLSLSAGSYVVDQQTIDGITAATFFLPHNRQLSATFLEASLRYLKRYSDLFGPYPFDRFSVVENFFPTGYGFPGYTLMGGKVLRLPFIPATSLPHEIVHNWWGNGVLVDFASGNWCEGLASYTADYLNKEQEAAEAAKDYRRQALRNYASLVAPTTDFPLNRFRSRTDPATKAVGYDKSAMVFHMLRQEVGDPVFWTALRDLYRRFQFKRAAWQDLLHIFEQHAGRPLDGFFRQWIDRPGSPQIRLEDVRQVSAGHGYRTTGRLVQAKPYYTITLKLVLDTAGEPIEQTVSSSGPPAEFEITSATRPHALTADPDYHLFRRLTPEEMPPTINTLKGSSSVVLVIANRMGRFGRPLARHVARAMGIDPIRTVAETDFSSADAVGCDLLFIGLPESPQPVDLLPRDRSLTPKAFELDGQRFDGPGDVLFAVHRHPDGSANVVALLHPLSPDAAEQASVKIPHYGRYSYLAFSDGHNRAKGTWEVNASPLMVRWNPANTPNQGATP